MGIRPMRLGADSGHGLRIGYRRPSELGADRVAAALGARAVLSGRDAIIVDCGTATTVTALRRDGTLVGGAIIPGAGLWSEILAARTAQLPRAAQRRPRGAIGRSPREAIAAGAFVGQAGAIRELVARIRSEAFPRARGRRPPGVIATGGGAADLASEGLFDRIDAALVLRGLCAFAAGAGTGGENAGLQAGSPRQS
jgi:type III pantothenate kinase